MEKVLRVTTSTYVIRYNSLYLCNLVTSPSTPIPLPSYSSSSYSPFPLVPHPPLSPSIPIPPSLPSSPTLSPPIAVQESFQHLPCLGNSLSKGCCLALFKVLNFFVRGFGRNWCEMKWPVKMISLCGPKISIPTLWEFLTGWRGGGGGVSGISRGGRRSLSSHQNNFPFCFISIVLSWYK